MPLSEEETQKLRRKAQACLDAWRSAPGGGGRFHLEEALDCYNKIIENASPNPEFYKERSEISFNLWHLYNAREDIGLAIKHNPNDSSYYSIRVRYNIQFVELLSHGYHPLDKREQLLRRIIADCNAALRKNPTNSFDWFALMASNILTYHWEEAIGNYGACQPFITDKKDRLIRSWLGCTALALAGDTIEALDIGPLKELGSNLFFGPLEQAISIFLLFRCYVEEYEHWQNAIDIQKLYFKHLDPLMKIKLFPGWGWHTETAEVIDNELELNPDSIDALFAPLPPQIESNCYPIMLKLYEKIKITDPDSSKVEKEISRLKKNIEEYDRREELLCNLVMTTQSNQDIKALLAKCDLLKKLDRYKEVVSVYEAIISLNPDNAYFWLMKGCILAEPLKRYNEALKDLDMATGLRPDHSDAYFVRASIHLKLRHYKEALNDYKTVTELNPQHCYAWFYLGNIYQILDHYKDALNVYDKADKSLASFAYAGYDMLRRYGVNGRADLLEKEKILYQKASVYSKIGDRAKTISNLSQAIEIDSYIKQEAKDDEAFKNLWGDEDFKGIVA